MVLREALDGLTDFYQMHKDYSREMGSENPLESESPVMGLLTSDIETVAQALEQLPEEEIREEAVYLIHPIVSDMREELMEEYDDETAEALVRGQYDLAAEMTGEDPEILREATATHFKDQIDQVEDVTGVRPAQNPFYTGVYDEVTGEYVPDDTAHPTEFYTTDLPLANNDIFGSHDIMDLTAALAEGETLSIADLSRLTGLSPQEVDQEINNMDGIVEEVPGEGYRFPEEIGESLMRFEKVMPEEAHNLPNLEELE